MFDKLLTRYRWHWTYTFGCTAASALEQQQHQQQREEYFQPTIDALVHQRNKSVYHIEPKMDRTNCSALWATDNLFERTPIGQCDSSLLFLYFGYGLVTLLRIFACIIKWSQYSRRRNLGLKASALGPILSTGLTISFILIFALTATNAINVQNGISFSCYSIGYFFFAAIYALSLLRMVHLGAKITSASPDVGNATSLEKFDMGGYALVCVAMSGLCVMSVVLIFAGPIYPEQDLLFGVIGWSSKAIFQASITCGLAWQMQRCYNVIRARMPESDKKRRVLVSLRRNQMRIFLLGMAVAVYYTLLASRVILWYWWAVFGISGYVEVLPALYLDLRKWRSATASSRKTTVNSKNPTPHNKQHPDERRVKSSSADFSGVSGSRDSNNNAGPTQMKGLGILTKKHKQPHYRPKMTRVTEMTENGTQFSQALASTNPLTEVSFADMTALQAPSLPERIAEDPSSLHAHEEDQLDQEKDENSACGDPTAKMVQPEMM